MINDRALVSKILNGDMQAFKLLIKQHENLVAHMIRRMIRQEEDREELCQDVFMKVYDKLGEFNFQSKLSTWIATIAFRHAINHLKKRKILWSEIPDEENINHAFVEPVNPETLFEAIDLDRHVLMLMECLPIQYKTVLTLYHVNDMNYAEIGQITGMPEGTVKNYLFRARHILKEKIKMYLGKEELL